MNTAAIAMILVADAICLASLNQPNLPDDFSGGKNQGTVAQVTWSRPVQSASPGLVASEVQVTQHWLVSEPWCGLCPAAKRKFLAEGHPSSRIINIATARQIGQNVSGVPFRFTTTAAKTIYQPPKYRAEWPPKWDVNGDRNASKSTYLSHLRNNTNHHGKHWQKWHLESWSREQLAALHSDDHDGVVPTFEASTDVPTVEAVVTGARGSPEVISQLLAVHLGSLKSTADAPPQSSVFNIDVDIPDSARSWASDLLTRRRVDFANGIVIDWSGDRSIKISDGHMAITPGARVNAEKFSISVSVSLTGISYTDDLSEVTLELAGAPDLTVRFR